MTVTAITELTGTRSKIEIDQTFAFVLYKGELRLYHIVLGEEISEKDYRTIMEEVLPKRARLRAMNLLTSKDYTTRKLRDKLKEGGYPEEIIEDALNYVASYHYTDDTRYALGFIKDHESTRSRRRIEQDLKNRGVSEEIIEEAWTKYEEETGGQDEEAMIEALLRKKGFDRETADQKQLQKMYAFLAGKGFSSEKILHSIRN